MVFTADQYKADINDRSREIIAKIDSFLAERAKQGEIPPIFIYRSAIFAKVSREQLKAVLVQYAEHGWHVHYREATDQRDEDSVTFTYRS